ncbi:hypothetical protein [Candidatus Palauibacter soopunensis]|nr:hypothetical protein [Candidatus Palauibacter soopunensis]
MDALLVELTRSPGSNFRVNLDLEGHTGEQGYPKDVVDVVKANARDLKIDGESFGFERRNRYPCDPNEATPRGGR